MTKGILPLLGAALVLAACGGDSEETVPGADTTAAPAAVAPAGADTTAAAAAAPAPSGTFLDPNTAPAEQLLTVPGFDQAMADAVVQGRPYADMTALDAVLSPRLSEEQRDTAYSRLWIPVRLNSASREELLLIPGVGPRMAREFEEYRPYRDMAQFRREMGKYVDDAEVARLERFFTLD